MNKIIAVTKTTKDMGTQTDKQEVLSPPKIKAERAFASIDLVEEMERESVWQKAYGRKCMAENLCVIRGGINGNL